jgi:nitrogen fixation protein
LDFGPIGSVLLQVGYDLQMQSIEQAGKSPITITNESVEKASEQISL